MPDTSGVTRSMRFDPLVGAVVRSSMHQIVVQGKPVEVRR